MLKYKSKKLGNFNSQRGEARKDNFSYVFLSLISSSDAESRPKIKCRFGCFVTIMKIQIS